MQADGPALVAFLVEAECGLVAILVKAGNLQTAGGAEADAGPEESFEDGANAVVGQALAYGQSDQLPGSRGGKRLRLLPWVRSTLY